MLRDLPLRTKLVAYGITLSIIPLVIVAGTTFFQSDKMIALLNKEMSQMATVDLDHIVKGVYAMCKAQQEVIQDNVNHSLNAAREVLKNTGVVEVAEETVEWDIVNQYTKSVRTVALPKFMVGEKWLGKNADIHEPSLIVDKVKGIVGGTCTIFQRINDDGDMLRVSTNVVKKDGRRAIGTFIPKKNPGGQNNPVVSTVLKGNTFRGRAFVVDRWYITAYEPIVDKANRIIGMLYVGIPQENVKSLRQAIVNTTIGKTGYVYVLDSKGNYVVSKNGERDGENILNIKDAHGKYPIKEIVEKALPLQPGQIAEQTYYWQNSGDPKPRLKIARIAYFKDWDWIIGAGVFTDEFRESQDQIARINRTHYIVLIMVIVITTIVTMIVWRLVAGGIVKPIKESVELADAMANGDFTQKVTVKQKNEIGILSNALNKMSESIKSIIVDISNGVNTLTVSANGLSAISKQMNQGSEATASQCRTVSVAADEVSDNMNSVASASEQISTNIQMVATAAEEMSTTLNEIAQNSDKARSITDSTVHKAVSATQKVNDLGMSAKEISKVTEVITEISEQTNLLALNATIEAARAGEAGKGFAVVANEIKELANQTATATLEIKTKIDGIQKATTLTVQEIEEISQIIKDINELVSATAAAVEEQSTTTREIAQNVSEASQSIQSVNQNISQSSQGSSEIAKEIGNVNKANEEISTGSSQVLNSSIELSTLSEKLNQLIDRFKIV